MGVVNVTPDSFSDGGLWFDPDAAIEHGLSLLAQGADLLDVGGESTRPGAQRPSEAEELSRVIPVISALSAAGAIVSIDTMRAGVAAAALTAGASLVNDVSGGLSDPAMIPLVAAAKVDYVCMHWRGHSADMQSRAVYDDVVAEVRDELTARVEALCAGGIDRARIILDPGLGFAKTAEHNWAVLRHLDAITALGQRVLVGASRKAFLGRVGRPPGHERLPLDRDVATAVTTAYIAAYHPWGIRVHDLPSSMDALDVAGIWQATP
ncbi:MAG: dihydropteroate synthase [Nostocoides sp.]